MPFSAFSLLTALLSFSPAQGFSMFLDKKFSEIGAAMNSFAEQVLGVLSSGGIILATIGIFIGAIVLVFILIMLIKRD